MEDSHISDLSVGTSKGTNVFGVFDGHGGKEVAVYVKKHFTEELVNSALYKKGEMKKALIVMAHAFSESARTKIEKAGGKAVLVPRAS